MFRINERVLTYRVGCDPKEGIIKNIDSENLCFIVEVNGRLEEHITLYKIPDDINKLIDIMKGDLLGFFKIIELFKLRMINENIEIGE